MAEIAVTFALEKLGDWLAQGLDRSVGEEVMRITDAIGDMRDFLNDADRRRDRDPTVEAWVNDARSLAYHVEDVVDEFMIRNQILAWIARFVEFLLAVPLGFINVRLPYSLFVILIPFLFMLVSWLESLGQRKIFLTRLRGIGTKVSEVSGRMGGFEFEPVVENERLEPHDGATSISPSVGIVGREIELMDMARWLIEDKTPGCMAIFVVGMVGTGKTSLASKAYERAKRHFDCYAWTFVSQSYKMETILRNVLRGFCESSSEVAPSGLDELDEVALKNRVAEYLQGKNYLLVLDDVWDESAWESLRHALPAPESESESECVGKVVFTTRNAGLPSRSSHQGSSNTLNLEPLSEEDAQNLFRRKALGHADHEDRTFPPELESIGEAILSKCDRLPLAIVTVGALLATKEGSPLEWQKVLEKLDWYLTSSGSVEDVFVSSGYADLTPVLKRCFLYCSLFPENYEIPRKKLVRMWVAEDFTQLSDGTPEEAAEHQLGQLIERNMLQVARFGMNGEIISCRVLWLMRTFACRMSHRDKFCTVMPSVGQSSIPNDRENVMPNSGQSNVQDQAVVMPNADQSIVPDEEDIMPKVNCKTFFQPNINQNTNLNEEDIMPNTGQSSVLDREVVMPNARQSSLPDWKDLRRLAVHSDAAKVIKSDMGTSKSLRSLLFFGTNEQQRTFISIRGLPSKLKLLHVLELQGLRIKKLPDGVGHLVLLRYLGLRGTGLRKLPKSLLELLELQTLDIRETEVRDLPDLYRLKKLRHLHLVGSFTYRVVAIPRGIMWATDLQTLAGVKVVDGLAQELGHLTRLKKLSIGKVRGEDSARLCASINKMKLLHSLTLKCDWGESFKIDRLAPLYHLNKLRLGGQVQKSLEWICGLTSLTYLYLWDSTLTDDPLSTLQHLPHLILLSLYNAYEGTYIHCDIGGFPKLKKLSVLHLRKLEEWGKIESGAMPELHKLFIGYCPCLIKPPEGLEDLTSLQIVQVAKMSVEFEEKVRENEGQNYKVQHIPQLTPVTWSQSTEGTLIPNNHRLVPIS